MSPFGCSTVRFMRYQKRWILHIASHFPRILTGFLYNSLCDLCETGLIILLSLGSGDNELGRFKSKWGYEIELNMDISFRIDAKISYTGNSNCCAEDRRSRSCIRDLRPIAHRLVITTCARRKNYS